MFTLPTELLTVLLSGAKLPHPPPPIAGESSIMLPLLAFLVGIIILFVVINGLLPGLCPGCLAASVEWCKFVHAREKSSPRECLGRDVAGEADRSA